MLNPKKGMVSNDIIYQNQVTASLKVSAEMIIVMKVSSSIVI